MFCYSISLTFMRLFKFHSFSWVSFGKLHIYIFRTLEIIVKFLNLLAKSCHDALNLCCICDDAPLCLCFIALRVSQRLMCSISQYTWPVWGAVAPHLVSLFPISPISTFIFTISFLLFFFGSLVLAAFQGSCPLSVFFSTLNPVLADCPDSRHKHLSSAKPHPFVCVTTYPTILPCYDLSSLHVHFPVSISRAWEQIKHI